MMKNKIELKKLLCGIFLVSIISVIIMLLINFYEYKVYTKNFNNKVIQIVSKIKNDYPNISEIELIKILNSKDIDNSIFKKYSIDLNNDSIIIENDNNHILFLIINLCLLILLITILVILFLKYNSKKDRQINDITRYIEEINRRNYSLSIDDISEDELSILKNEVYKTTIMLKEIATNSLNDKKNLKKSLEDISHQLKTPLTSVLVLLDNLIDDPNMNSDIRDEFIRDIKREIVNINFLIQNILKLAKFDSNTIHFIKEKVSLNNIIQEAVRNVSIICDIKNISLEIIGDSNAKITCDFKWQVEAITNIIKNCIENSSQNSKIRINYHQNNVYASIEIQDFGNGIPKEDLPHIFERFYRGKNTTSNGIGIGLSLSKSIIEEDNGHISVETNNKGTKFIIKYFK